MKPLVVGIAGRLFSGKDTVANYMVSDHNYTRYAFADALKRLCSFAIDKEEIGWNGQSWGGEKSEKGRKLLQAMGHGAREALHPDIWIMALDREIKLNAPQWVVISDVRYPSEARYIKENLGGLLIKVIRPDIDRSGPEHQHPTEIYIDKMAVDCEIVNDGTVDELFEKIRWFIIDPESL